MMRPPVVSRTTIPSRLRLPSGRPLFWLIMLPVCAATGLLYAKIFGSPTVWPSLVYATAIGGLNIAFERGLLFGALQERIRRLPTLVYIPLAEAIYVGLTAFATAVVGVALWSTGLIGGRLSEAALLTPQIALYALVCSAILVFLVRVRDLIGADAFVALVTGRYHRPVAEERIFLFIDVIGSTAYAERHGDLKAQAFLGAFFATLADPVRRHGGSIDDYIGDMALITWPMAKGIRQSRCVACVFDVGAAIAEAESAWVAEFGRMPAFRAALHGGSVVTAEIGVDRHKISYFGDCVNTTARIESLCRSLDAPILISGDLLERLPGLPPGIVPQPQGEHALRGRDRSVSVVALASAAGLAASVRADARRRRIG